MTWTNGGGDIGEMTESIKFVLTLLNWNDRDIIVISLILSIIFHSMPSFAHFIRHKGNMAKDFVHQIKYK